MSAVPPQFANTKKAASSAAQNERPSAKAPAFPARTAVAPDRIRARAFQIYEARSRNGLPGDPMSDWAEAERELNSAAAQSTVSGEVEAKEQARGEKLLASDE